MDKETTLKVAKHLDAMFKQANEALYLVNNNAPDATRERFQKVLGAAVAEIDLELLEPIYKQFPELRPGGMEEIRKRKPD
jgi:hypothetical protein